MTQLFHAFCASTLVLLTACGGGGGGGGATTASTTPSSTTAPVLTPTPTAAANYASFGEIKAPAGMNWQLSAAKSIPFTVNYSNNSAAAGVVIKLFTYSTSDPHASKAPADVSTIITDPVALSLIDTLVTDASGQVSWNINLPTQLSSVLAVISDGSNTSSQIVQLGQTGAITLTLAN
jgi:hypothetical protein